MQAAETQVAQRLAGDEAERKGQRTRRRILETARRVFAEVGYERATIRGIAAAAEVDKSSINKYFGTKQGLFREAVHWDIPVAQHTSDDAADTATRLAQAMLEAWAADPNSPMAVLLRTSMTSDEAAEMLRVRITSQAIEPVSAIIDAPDARLRAALAGAMLMGIASQKYILKMPDLRDADVEDIVGLVAPLLAMLMNQPPSTRDGVKPTKGRG